MEKKDSKSSKNNQLIAQTFRSYLSMSILITLSATLGMMIDNVIAGQTMGADAVGAIGMSTPLLMLFSGCAGILETGAVTLSARALGKRDSNQVNALFSIALVAGLAIGLLCLLVGHFGSATIASLLGADDPRLFESTTAFITGLSLGALPIILLQLVMGFVRLDGSPQLGLVAILTMSICDVSFNLIAVLVLDAGLLGMGTSTALAYYIALDVASTHFFGKKCSLRLVNPLPYLSSLGRLLKTGMPDSMVRVCVMLRTFTYNNLLLMVSTASAVAALSMLTSVNMFLSAVSVGVGQTATLLCGIFFGEQDRDAIKGTVMVALKTGMALCLLLCVLVFIFAPTVVSFFGLTDPEAKALGVIAVRVYCFAVPLDLVNNVFARYYQSSGNLKGATSSPQARPSCAASCSRSSRSGSWVLWAFGSPSCSARLRPWSSRLRLLSSRGARSMQRAVRRQPGLLLPLPRKPGHSILRVPAWSIRCSTCPMDSRATGRLLPSSSAGRSRAMQPGVPKKWRIGAVKTVSIPSEAICCRWP